MEGPGKTAKIFLENLATFLIARKIELWYDNVYIEEYIKHYTLLFSIILFSSRFWQEKF